MQQLISWNIPVLRWLFFCINAATDFMNHTSTSLTIFLFECSNWFYETNQYFADCISVSMQHPFPFNISVLRSLCAPDAKSAAQKYIKLSAKQSVPPSWLLFRLLEDAIIFKHLCIFTNVDSKFLAKRKIRDLIAQFQHTDGQKQSMNKLLCAWPCRTIPTQVRRKEHTHELLMLWIRAVISAEWYIHARPSRDIPTKVWLKAFRCDWRARFLWGTRLAERQTRLFEGTYCLAETTLRTICCE